MSKSYIAKYWHTENGMLVGGVTHGESSRWGERRDAVERLRLIKEMNGPKCDGEIVESNLPPEIFRHCGGNTQAIGSKCPACGQMLTQEDAKNHKEKINGNAEQEPLVRKSESQ